MAQIAPGPLVQLYQFIFNRIVDRLQNLYEKPTEYRRFSLDPGLIAHNKLFAGLQNATSTPGWYMFRTPSAGSPCAGKGRWPPCLHPARPARAGRAPQVFCAQIQQLCANAAAAGGLCDKQVADLPVLWQTPTMPSGVSEVVCR